MFEDRGLNSIFTEEKRQMLISHPYFKESMEYLRNKAEEFLKTDPPRLKYSDMHTYYSEKGTREPYDSKYWQYPTRLRIYFAMYMLYGEEKYLPEIADMLYDICNMETWSSAQGCEEELSLERRKTMLNLRSTGVGRDVAMVLYYLGDKMPELVYRRAKAELRERIIDAYAKNYDYWWMRTTLNWAAVCTGNILMTYLYVAEKNEISEMLPRMLHSLELYMSGFDSEGCCPEGYGYWNYGFMHYVPAALLLRDYTKGEIDLFKEPKVHKVALFQQNAAINDTQAIRFSDTTKNFNPIPWLCHFLKSEYDDIEIPPVKAPATFDGAIFNLACMNPDYQSCTMKGKSFFYSGAQWFIYRSDAYNFVIKAGYNNEPHNHNDAGSFAISKNGKITFDDPGRARYDRAYFDESQRYVVYACASSRGHSAPIVNGKYQIKEKEKCKVVSVSDNEFSFNMQQAYGLEELTLLNRHVICKNDGISLTDTYEFTSAPESLVERFVSLIEPEFTSDGVKVGDSILIYDKEKVCDPTVSYEEFDVDGGGVRRVYQIDFALKELAENISVSFKFI